ncbi:MAG: hypothetical protein QW035_02440 [Candidatus Anstonellales archaeon]
MHFVFPELERMRPRFEWALKELEQSKSIKVRYHLDADGIVGAAYILEAFGCAFEGQKSPHYASLEEDLRSSFDCIVLLDIGSTEEKLEDVLSIASAKRLIIIDHHPAPAELKEHSLNPCFHLESGSRYPAGYLAYELARCKGVENDWYRLAIAGDKSDIGYSGEERDIATVIDYLAHHNVKLKDIVRALKSKDDLLYYLPEMASLKEVVISKIEASASKQGVVKVVDLRPFFGSFPGAGKALGMACEAWKGYIVVGTGEKTVLVRTDKDIGLGLLVSHIKKAFGGKIRSAGGHSKAVAIITEKGYENVVRDECIKFLNNLH